ncbi:MAG TPA: TonB-dependent receptor [Opitutaceae bacterium]|nr:TonB-dependent receptor [Opitutaceae bacterium]
MNFRPFSFSSALSLATCAALATSAARAQSAFTPTSDSNNREVIHLDTLVVSSTTDPRSVFDLAQGASALTGSELRMREAATLGETLSATPGINSTYYGPGASRPIIRGLGGDRVRMLDNGIGSLDASNVSPDHNTAIEPLLVDRIEVLRGPSALLYGSSAVGGVVNVVDNRIPTAPSANLLNGRAEVRFDTAANERTGVVAVNGGNNTLGVEVQGLRTITDDFSIPGVAQIGPDAPADQPSGTLPSSAISTKSGSAGLSYFWTGGFIGAAASEYDTHYGVPTGDEPSTSIDMRQRRLDLRAETNQPFAFFKGTRARFGLADYEHSELTGASQINTTFHNKAYEGRFELLQQELGRFSGVIGWQTSRSDFSAVGEEVVTPASVTMNNALFASEEFKVSDKLRLQYGARFEHQEIKLGEVDPALPAFPGWSPTSGERRVQNAPSFSGGLVWYPANNYSVGFSLSQTARPPVAQELFSNGPHGGTAAYEVGTSALGNERSTGVDLTVRRRAGRITGELALFANRFSNYVFEEQLPADTIENPNNPDALTTYQFVARDAVFYGAEAEVTAHLIDTPATQVHLEVNGDYVHAQEITDHEPLPRTPPLRLGAALRWQHAAWSASLDYRHVFRQDRVGILETETGGYSLIGAEAAYSLRWSGATYELFARGSNLADAEARVHTSFLKDFAPLPGRNFTFGLRAMF